MLHQGGGHPAVPFELFCDAVAGRYRPAGRFAQGFVRGKLRHDPVYRFLFESGLPDAEGAVLDLGCGRGIALSVLATACAFGLFPGTLRSPPPWIGIERRPSHAAAARAALGTGAEIRTQDLLVADLPRARLILLVDVLLYLSADQQRAVLERAVRQLTAGGRLVIREADAEAGWRFNVTAAAERASAWRRGEWAQSYHYRSRTEWLRQLNALGLRVQITPMSMGTPFANVVFSAERP